MRCIAICAFREPFMDRFVEAIYPGQEIEVPDALIDGLVADGHLERPSVLDESAAATSEEAPAQASRARRRKGAEV